MLYVPSLILVHSFFASADAFVRPITFIQTSSTLSPCGQHQQQYQQYQYYYNPSLSLLELSAAKKKKKSKQKNKPASSSGMKKGFGQSSDYSATAITSIDEVPVESSTSTSTSSRSGTSSSSSSSSITTISNSDSDSSPPIHQDLLTWLNQHPNTYISPKFTIQPSPYGGYGGFVVSSSSSLSLSLPGVMADELLFRIPRECCVTYNDALSDPDCGSIFQLVKKERVPSWGMVLIAGYIAKEYLLAKEELLLYCDDEQDNELSSSSSWGTTNNSTMDSSSSRIKHLAYLQSVPWKQGELNQDHVLFWSEDEVETLLKGSYAYNDAVLIRSTVHNAVQLLSDFVVPVIQQQQQQQLNKEKPTEQIQQELEEVFKGAFVIALSRSFAEEVELDDDDDMTIEIENLLLPLIDILQHSNTPNTYLEPYEDYILVRAKRNVEPGEELFHQYQEEDENVIPKHKFFTRYGFIPGVRESVVDLLKGRSPLFFNETILL